MENLVALLLLNVTAPGVAAGLATAIAKRRGMHGTVTNLLLGSAGGLFGGVIALQVLHKLQIAPAQHDMWLVWVASVVGGLFAITVFRGMAKVLVEVTETEETA